MKTDLQIILMSLVEQQYKVLKDHSDDISMLAYDTAVQVMKDWPEFNLNEEFAENMKTAIKLHDIGKLKIPRNILAKPSSLTEDEYRTVQKHTLYGLDILSKETVGFLCSFTPEEYMLLDTCKEIIRSHHERLDGSGYPYGLKGDEIPLSAQIAGIIDSYDAMISSRVYKVAIEPREAIESLMRETDKYNEKILKSFSKVINVNMDKSY